MSDIKFSAGAADGRAGVDGAPRAPRRNGPVSRHGAISRHLTKYSTYKLWADKVRTTWRSESGEGPLEPAPGTARR